MKEILQGKIRPFDHHDEPVCCHEENHRYQTPMGDDPQFPPYPISNLSISL